MNRIAVALMLTCVVAMGCGGSQSTQSTQASGTNTGAQPSGVATGAHVQGSANAKVTIVEFGDFQCPYCRSFYTDTEWQIINAYVNTGKAVFAYRQFPLNSIHPYAQNAAEASECAAQVGGNDAFWKYHNTLFTTGVGDVAVLKQYAADIQLDSASFNSCLDNHVTATIVSKDVTEGTAAGVHSTPTFFINGKPLVGAQPFSAFQTAIDAALAGN